MRVWKQMGLASVAAVVLGTGTAQADPLVNLQILGSKTLGSGYSSHVTGLQAGDTVYLEIVGQLASIGTANTTKGVSINSLTSGTDGISSLKFDLSATGGSTFASASLAGPSTTPVAQINWAAGAGAAAGTISGSALTGLRPAAALGVYDAATSPDVIWFGQVTVGSSDSTIAGLWNGSGSIRINGTGSSLTINNTTETSADALVHFNNLALSVPEPTSFGVLGMVSLGFIARRRPHA